MENIMVEKIGRAVIEKNKYFAVRKIRNGNSTRKT